jgi:tRNA nucleotidyltransferase (CCA-adding enzyme)
MKTVELTGPPIKMSEHAEIFRKKHKKAFVKGSRLFSIEKRKFTDAKTFIKNIIKTENIKDNVKSIRVL